MPQILIESSQNIMKSDIIVQSDTSMGYDFMQLFRIVLYIIVFVKIIELSFFRKKKLSLKQRISRKFLFAHQEMLKQFTQEDKTSMEIIINNTLKNSNIQKNAKSIRKQKSTKRVNFQINKNEYYDPKNNKNDDEDVYLDIEQKIALKNEIKSQPFQSKKIEDEFHEREDIVCLNQKASQISTEGSDLMIQKNESINEDKKQSLIDVGQKQQELHTDQQNNTKNKLQ